MPRKKPADTNDDQLYASLFSLIAKQGWWALTLPKIAKAVKIPLSALLEKYADKQAVLAGFLPFIDRKLAETEMEEGADLKERLFEIIMRRLEIMQPYRAGLVRLMDDVIRQPLSAVCLGIELAPRARRSLKLVLELAEAPIRPPLGEPALLGLKLVVLQTLRAWKNDESADLSPTMAALDRALGRYLSFLRMG